MSADDRRAWASELWMTTSPEPYPPPAPQLHPSPRRRRSPCPRSPGRRAVRARHVARAGVDEIRPAEHLLTPRRPSPCPPCRCPPAGGHHVTGNRYRSWSRPGRAQGHVAEPCPGSDSRHRRRSRSGRCAVVHRERAFELAAAHRADDVRTATLLPAGSAICAVVVEIGAEEVFSL